MINNEVEKIRIEVGKTENELQELEQYIKDLKMNMLDDLLFVFNQKYISSANVYFASDNLNEAFLFTIPTRIRKCTPSG